MYQSIVYISVYGVL